MGVGKIYKVGFWLTSVVTFFVCWIYAAVAYGLFIGIGLGWIPSLVIALIAGLVWPLIALVVGVIVIVLIFVLSGNK